VHALIAVLLVAAQPQEEAPLAKVLVLGSEQSPVPPTFVEALRIQVIELAQVANARRCYLVPVLSNRSRAP
jgi:hypothetical protein